MRSLRIVFLLLFVSLGAHAQLPLDVDDVANRALKAFEVPGIAVGIVKDGKVVMAKGYGVRELGKPAPVDADTLFAIASNTKAFTTASLAMMADEGKLDWDDPVVKHLPAFALYDPYVTRELTIRDLVTHRSGLGLGAGDLMWWPHTDLSRDEVVRRIRFIKPATSFRSHYAYDNLLYLVAGKVLESASGKTWDDFVRERIFVPLGMTRTNTSVAALANATNVATPHARLGFGGPLSVTAYQPADNTGPAAAINSSVNDLTKWAIAQLDRGVYRDAAGKEQRLFSEKQSREMWSPQTILPISATPPKPLEPLKANFAAYGLGWSLRDYRGHKIATHTGGLAGMVSRIMLVPDERLGVIVLTNAESSGAFDSIAWSVVNAYVGGPKNDWVAAFKEANSARDAKTLEEEKKRDEARAKESKPSLPLDQYAGRYVDPWYGDVTVAKEGDHLVMRFSHTPDLVGDLQHWQYDTFRAAWRNRSLNGDAFVTFHLGPDGKIESVKMVPVSALVDFSFDYQDLDLRPAPEPAK